MGGAGVLAELSDWRSWGCGAGGCAELGMGGVGGWVERRRVSFFSLSFFFLFQWCIFYAFLNIAQLSRFPSIIFKFSYFGSFTI